MKKLILLVCTLSILLSFAGCSGLRKGPPVDEQKLYEDLFNVNNKISIKLDMSDLELAKLQADYDKYAGKNEGSAAYRMADLTVTITTPDGKETAYKVEQVGVRMKGKSYSRSDFFSYEDGIYNHVHLKISFKETFDDPLIYGDQALSWTDAERQARKNRTFATLEKLNLKWNRSDDPTYIRSYYCGMVHREHGILSPRGTLATFNWSGLHMGVYTIFEPVDKIFLNRYLPESARGGDLYKCVYMTKFDGENTIGVEDAVKRRFYDFDLKTNKKTSNHSSLKRLLDMLNNGTPTKEEFAELVDMDYWLTLNAVAYFIGNGDDMRNDYNNIYVYFRPDTGKAIFIPHDFDRGLGVTGNYLDVHDTMTKDHPFTKVMGWFGWIQENPLYLYSICEGGYFLEEYTEKLWEVSKSPFFTNEKFNEYYYIAENLYDDDTTPGRNLKNASDKYLSFSLKRTAPVNDKKNTSFANYIETKFSNFYKYMGAEPQG